VDENHAAGQRVDLTEVDRRMLRVLLSPICSCDSVPPLNVTARCRSPVVSAWKTIDRPEAAISLIVPTVLDRFVQQAALQVLQGPMGRNVQRA
jgi:hypothetical protein